MLISGVQRKHKHTENRLVAGVWGCEVGEGSQKLTHFQLQNKCHRAVMDSMVTIVNTILHV